MIGSSLSLSVSAALSAGETPVAIPTDAPANIFAALLQSLQPERQVPPVEEAAELADGGKDEKDLADTVPAEVPAVPVSLDPNPIQPPVAAIAVNVPAIGPLPVAEARNISVDSAAAEKTIEPLMALPGRISRPEPARTLATNVAPIEPLRQASVEGEDVLALATSPEAMPSIVVEGVTPHAIQAGLTASIPAPASSPVPVEAVPSPGMAQMAMTESRPRSDLSPVPLRLADIAASADTGTAMRDTSPLDAPVPVGKVLPEPAVPNGGELQAPARDRTSAAALPPAPAMEASLRPRQAEAPGQSPATPPPAPVPAAPGKADIPTSRPTPLIQAASPPAPAYPILAALMESAPAAQATAPDAAMSHERMVAPTPDAVPAPAVLSDPTTPDSIAATPDAAIPVSPPPLPAAPPPSVVPGMAITADPHPAPADLALQSQLDLAHDGAWLDGLAHDIALAATRETELRFHLNPEHLGTLKVELQNGADGTAVRLTANTEAARQILADVQPRLIAEARAQGVRISEAHVDLGQQSGGQQSQQQHRAREDWQPFNHIRRQAAEAASESSSDTAERYA